MSPPTTGPAVIRFLLRFAPTEYRERYGPQVLLFASERLHSRASTGESGLRAWSRVVFDLALTIALEWTRPRNVIERQLPAEDRMSVIAQEIAHASRSLRKSAGFTTAAVITLALGLASTTAIFSIVESVLLRPLPFPESERVVIPETLRIGTTDRSWLSYADFMDWRDNGVFAAVATYREMDMDLTGSGDPVRVATAAVSPQFFEVLRVRPAAGRVLERHDFPVDAPRAVVISDHLWKTQFGGRADIVGSVVEINAIKRPIVGVMPPRTRWPMNADIWVPQRFATELDPGMQRRDNLMYQGIARLKPGATMESTGAAMEQLAARVRQAEPIIRKDISTVPTPILTWLLGETTPRALWLLLGAVGLLLLIACVNVANLQLARATARQREMAVRTALGASRYRLVRQTLVDSALLGIAGGAMGVVLAHWMVKAMVAAAPPDVPRLAEATLSLPALAFAFTISIIVALLFGLVPAIQASRSDPNLAMGESTARTHGGRSTSRIRRTLVVAELALSVLLLVGAGLALRSIQQLRAVNPGFNAPSVLSASISLPGARYRTSEDVVRFMYALRDRLAAAPGIRGAGIASSGPLSTGGFYLGRSMAMEGKSPTLENEISVLWAGATPGYFGALGIPIRGRDFTPRDDTASTPVMIVSESFVKAMFGTENPIGRRAMSTRDEKVYREIIGVVRDVRLFGLRDTAQALVWVPYAQRNSFSQGVVAVRVDGAAVTAVGALRREVAAIDRNVALANVTTMDEAASRSIAGDRLLAVLLTAFATLALVLASVGIFGVLSYTVVQRTREIGVRMALGAGRADVLTLVLRETAPLVAIGIGIGIGAGLALTRLMRAMLFEIQPTDPVTFIGVALVLSVVGLIAALVPARRAASINPVVALRND